MTDLLSDVRASRSGSKLGSLELGRGIAALAVVAHHAGQASDAFTSQKYGGWFENGMPGVDFFFVLSGFIIFHVHRDDPRTPSAALRYWTKRLRRIYVPYLPIALVMIAAYALLPSLSQGNRDWGLFTTLTLMPTGAPPALSVAWTLVFEMMFYIVFLVSYFTRYFSLILIAWVVITIGLAVSGWEEVYALEPFATLFNPLILEFVAGMAMAVLFIRVSPSKWAFPVLLGIAGVAAYFLMDDLHRVFFGLSLAPIVLGLALAEVRFGYCLPKPVLLVGAASYAIYLIHNPLHSLLARVLKGFDYWPVTFGACVLGGVLAGIIYHLMFEKPVLRLLSSGGKMISLRGGV